MREDPPDLPDFADPPINESALSIQFQPLASFGIPHFGLYWQKIRPEFGRFQLVPPIPQTTEQFAGPQPIRLNLQLLAQPEVRCWFLDATGERLVQVQRDRFIHNWRQIDGTEKYPRYPTIRKSLHRHWITFMEFLQAEGLEPPNVNQCEVTYVNHIEYGRGWTGFGVLNQVVAPWSGKHVDGFLPAPERVGLEVHYCLPNDLGRLHVSAAPVVRGRDSREVFQVTLTARGAPVSTAIDDVFDWLDLGRQWVVKGFADFTSDAMQKIWGRKR